MSNFKCEKCGVRLFDSDIGYINECEHYPKEPKSEFMSKENKMIPKFSTLGACASEIEFPDAAPPKYIENPKGKGSGVISCIPQAGTCPNNCPDCFFQSGRSYLEPLVDNLPNMPRVRLRGGVGGECDLDMFNVVRVNDGNDSNNDRELVMRKTAIYPMRFYNTCIPDNLEQFDAPVVLTVNPGEMTDKDFHNIEHPIPENLMFVRFRTNTWNLELCNDVVEHYTDYGVPIVLTFMAYFDEPIPEKHGLNYVFRKRTLNSYSAITTFAWRAVMKRYEDNEWVHSCGKIEGEKGSTKCRHCGNCLREYFATKERMKNVE